MNDHVDNPQMTVEEAQEQGRRDDLEALRFIGEHLAQNVSTDDRDTALRVLRQIAETPLDRLYGRIETDGTGNPLYMYGARMVWSRAHEITKDAAGLEHRISQATLAHRGEYDRKEEKE